jgi:hypothetical protein
MAVVVPMTSAYLWSKESLLGNTTEKCHKKLGKSNWKIDQEIKNFMP